MNVGPGAGRHGKSGSPTSGVVRAYRPHAVILAVCLNDIPELQNNLARPPEWLAGLFRRSALVRRVVNAKGREIKASSSFSPTRVRRG